MHRLKSLSVLSVQGFAMVLGFAKAEWAQERGGISMEATTGRETIGALQYRQHCAPCHGLTGKGDGPAAAALAKKPADLTMLTKNNQGGVPL